MINLFISYRRDDSAGYAGRLSDSLVRHFGGANIFRDIEDIYPGDDFVEAIKQNLQRANAVLVVIGPAWLNAKNENGQLRLHDPKDFVRLEIETALQLNHLIIPVLIDEATMPSPDQLPESLARIAFHQALQCTDNHWDEDIIRLVNVLLKSPSKSDKTSRLKHTIRVLSQKRVFALACAALMIAGALAWVFLQPEVTPDFSGNWYFAGGDYLSIRQEGDRFQVERIDPAQQTTYEKGTGIIKGRRLEFDLEPIYTDKFRYRGQLELDVDQQQLHGNLLEVLSDQTIPVELNRSGSPKT